LENLEEFIQVHNRYNWKPAKGKTCVLLIDLQEYFRQLITPIMGNLKRIISVTKEKNVPLIFSQHGHLRDEHPGMLGQWWADLIEKGSSDARLLPELNLSRQGTIIEKDRYSAFHKTDLEERLKEKNISDLVIGGVMTNLCCETTARDAFVRDYRVFFLADGTSTVDNEYHQASLKNLAYGFAILLTCENLVKIIQGWQNF
jgi:isochorismate hydrolase